MRKTGRDIAYVVNVSAASEPLRKKKSSSYKKLLLKLIVNMIRFIFCLLGLTTLL